MIARPLRTPPDAEQLPLLHLLPTAQPPLAPAPARPAAPRPPRAPHEPPQETPGAQGEGLAPLHTLDVVPDGASAFYHLAASAPLCSRAEERALLWRLEAGRPRHVSLARNRARDRRRGRGAGVADYYRALSPDARAAVDELVRRNLRLCIPFARKWEKYLRDQGHGLGMEDLLAEATLGLLHGILKYDRATGNALSTYVAWWIRQACQRAVQLQGPAIHVPVWLQQVRHLEPVPALPEGVLEAMTPAQQRAHRQAATRYAAWAEYVAAHERVEQVESLNRVNSPTSPSGHQWGEPDLELIDSVADERAETAYDDAERGVLRRSLLAELRQAAALSDREWLVLRLRFGLEAGDGDVDSDGTSEEVPLRELGKRLGIAGERVRQVEEAALGKLRAAAARDDRLLATLREVVG